MFTVRPSVAQDFVLIEFAKYLDNKEKELVVLNGLGKVITNLKIDRAGAYTLDTEALSNGIYFLQIGAEGTVFSRKFIIQK